MSDFIGDKISEQGQIGDTEPIAGSRSYINSSANCGICGKYFSRISEMYQHQQEEHDPYGDFISELGLPK